MLPSAERLLLGPGPSPVSPRVMRAMATLRSVTTFLNALEVVLRPRRYARGAGASAAAAEAAR
jgi:hypothetical protein